MLSDPKIQITLAKPTISRSANSYPDQASIGNDAPSVELECLYLSPELLSDLRDYIAGGLNFADLLKRLGSF